MSKQEVITEDEEIDVNVDDDEDDGQFDKTDSKNLSKFSFSISNILSPSFGPKPVKIEIEPNQGLDKNLFRPFEIRNIICNNYTANSSNSSSVLLSNFRLSEILNGTKNVSSQTISDNSLRASLYNSLASYPKIHEEILNSHKKHSTNIQQASNNIHLTSSSSKLQPLGGLRKTISQIGQENLTQSQLSPSSTPSSAIKSLAQSKSNLSDSLKIQQSSTDSIDDSDDCTSEASAKDETKMWPAWVRKFNFAYSIASN